MKEIYTQRFTCKKDKAYLKINGYLIDNKHSNPFYYFIFLLYRFVNKTPNYVIGYEMVCNKCGSIYQIDKNEVEEMV